MRQAIGAVLAALLLSSLAPGRADAGLTITFTNAGVAAGGSATVDIYASSNSNATLLGFGLELLITPSAGATSLLTFSPNNGAAPTASNYIYAGHSLALEQNIAYWGSPTSTNFPGDTIDGGDLYDPLGGFVTLGETNNVPNQYLLGEVQVQAPSNATVGEQFTISLVADPSFTLFYDQDLNQQPYTVDGSSTVTVMPSTVPEPSSLGLLAIAGLGGLLWRRLRRPVRALAA